VGELIFEKPDRRRKAEELRESGKDHALLNDLENIVCGV
jgi:hypothetical protein